MLLWITPAMFVSIISSVLLYLKGDENSIVMVGYCFSHWSLASIIDIAITTVHIR